MEPITNSAEIINTEPKLFDENLNQGRIRNLPDLDVNSYIYDSPEIKNILRNNPGLILIEKMRMIHGYEYFGLLQMNTVYLVMTKYGIVSSTVCFYKATQEVIKQFMDRVYFLNNPLLSPVP